MKTTNSVTKEVLNLFAERIRLASIRSMASFGNGHVGGVLSMSELFAVLYGEVLDIKVEQPLWEDRDRLVLSKGHCGPALYAALALKGFFPVEELMTLNQDGSNLPSHCNMFDTIGVDSGTGSLGQGSSISAGLSLGMKLTDKNCFSYLVLGDGECNEGQVWEMALFSAHHRLDNLIAFVDMNHQQLDGYTKDVCNMGDIAAKFEVFGWHSCTIDGHDVEAIRSAIALAKKVKDKPSVIVLDTIKGKGWSLTEGKPNVHHSVITADALLLAEHEIGARISDLERVLEK